MNPVAAEEEKVDVKEAGEALFNFAIDRGDLKLLMGNLPEDETVSPVTVEYEIQLLKILSVGWGISFFMEDSGTKKKLVEVFWHTVRDFSARISQITSSTSGKEVDYFSILKERVDRYVDVLNLNPGASNPVAIIGPEFARVCGSENNPHLILAGSKVFSLSIGGVRDYLAAVFND